MTRLLIFIISVLALALACAAPSWAGSCTVLSDANSTDLRPCSTEARPTGEIRHLNLDLSNPGPGIARRVLDLGVPDVVVLDVTQLELDSDGAPQKRAPERLQSLTAASAFGARVLPSPRVAVPLALAPGRHRIVLDYRIHVGGRLYPRLVDDATWRARNALGDVFSGLQLGLMLSSLILVVTTQLLAKDWVNIAYAALLLSHGFGLMQTRGDAFAYLWPNAPLFNQWITMIMVSLVVCTHAWFATQFLRLRERSPRVFRLHLLLMGLFAVNPFLLPTESAAAVAVLLAAAYAVLASSVALRSLRGGAPDTRLYAAGVGSYILFTIVLFVICLTGHSPWPEFDFFLLPEIGYLLETLFLGASLLWRLRQLRERQFAARQQHLLDARSLVEVEAARRAANARSERSELLFAGASHDLAQPLASLRMALGALRGLDGHEPIANHLDHTISYAQTLMRDILTQARNEHRTQVDRFVLGDCIAHVVREHQPAALAKGLTLIVVDSQVEVRTSALLVARVLHNLLSNAVRYTQRGRILVGVRRRANGVELQVLDTGPGMLPGQLAKLRAPFLQGVEAAPDGHGLGLFIVRTVCEQNGYGLRIASHPGRGSTFAVLLPVLAVVPSTESCN